MRACWQAVAGLAMVAAAGAAPPARAAMPDQAGVQVAGSELRLGLPDGRVLSGQALVGVVLSLRDAGGVPLRVKIEGVGSDPRDKTGEIRLYRFTAPGPAGDWQPVCSPDPDGQPLGLAVYGGEGRLAIWCTAGALAKCVRFGYRPWASLPDGTALARYHRACVNLVRADYTGDDRPTTRNGMLIDVYDRIGIQSPEGGPEAMPFEAAWGEHGAVCVAHTRVPQNLTLDGLLARAPHLRGRLGAECSEEDAAGMGEVLLYNRSRGDGIPGGRFGPASVAGQR
jgi:hypothetical protein